MVGTFEVVSCEDEAMLVTVFHPPPDEFVAEDATLDEPGFAEAHRGAEGAAGAQPPLPLDDFSPVEGGTGANEPTGAAGLASFMPAAAANLRSSFSSRFRSFSFCFDVSLGRWDACISLKRCELEVQIKSASVQKIRVKL